jgi:hypothetical protein
MNISWRQTINNELTHAQSARDSGNEGMARVCSRRAAGAAIGKYFAEHQLPDPGSNAFDRLNILKTIPDIPEKALKAAQLLTLRVDVNHHLPVEADLIAEARKLIVVLIPDFQFQKD